MKPILIKVLFDYLLRAKKLDSSFDFIKERLIITVNNIFVIDKANIPRSLDSFGDVKLLFFESVNFG